MNKEAAGREGQTGMQKTILELKVRNSAEGGMLFAVFGRGGTEALIFPTSAVCVEGADEDLCLTEAFLMVTNDGNKIIHFDDPLNFKGESLKADFITAIVRERLGKKQESYRDLFPSHSRYEDDVLSLYNGNLSINTRGTTHVRTPRTLFDEPAVDSYTNCRLMDASEYQVEEILRLNIRRVEAERATSQKVSDILGKVG